MRLQFAVEITEDDHKMRVSRQMLKELANDIAGAVAENARVEGNAVECKPLDESKELTQVRERSQEIAAECYQLAGVLNAPVRVLDSLSAAASGEPFVGFLPISPDECELVVRMEKAELELTQAREELRQERSIKEAEKKILIAEIETSTRLRSELEEVKVERDLFLRLPRASEHLTKIVKVNAVCWKLYFGGVFCGSHNSEEHAKTIEKLLWDAVERYWRLSIWCKTLPRIKYSDGKWRNMVADLEDRLGKAEAENKRLREALDGDSQTPDESSRTQ